MNFAKNLKKYREAAGYSAKNFAAALGIPQSTYNGYENGGREPKYDTLCAIAQKLNVSIDELVGNTPPPTIEQYLRIVRSSGFTVNVDGQSRDFLITNEADENSPPVQYKLPERVFRVWVESALQSVEQNYPQQIRNALRMQLGLAAYIARFGVKIRAAAATYAKPDEK